MTKRDASDERLGHAIRSDEYVGADQRAQTIRSPLTLSKIQDTDLPLALNAAIVHDWLAGMYGSERVVESISRLFASPPSIHTFVAVRDALPVDIARAVATESRLAHLPGLRPTASGSGHWRVLLPYMPLYFRRLRLPPCDIVISSSHSCALGVRAPRGTPHLVYCHTPMRYAWLPGVDGDRNGRIVSAGLRALSGSLRAWDRHAAQRPDLLIANSTAVADRIRRFYGREATVIFPPVNVDEFTPNPSHDTTHFLWVHRMVEYKRPLQVMEAFRSLPHLRLTMIGVGPLQEKVRALAPPNVTVRGWVDRAELTRLFSSCGAFIHIADEDFGISMVEAMAAGMPVVGLDAGGARDIVTEGTGVRVPAPLAATSTDLIAAIDAVATSTWSVERIRAHADQFSEARFHREMRAAIESLLS